MTALTFSEQAKKLNKILGFGCLQSYRSLWGTTIKTWGHKDASMWFVTYHTNEKSDVIVSFETNRTYFKPTDKQQEEAAKFIRELQN